MTKRAHLAILLAIYLLPPLGIIVSLWLQGEEARRRIDVQFVGYRIPWELLGDCDRPPDPTASGGFWIGGGMRWENDAEPDSWVLPGYRSHLVEICADRQSGAHAVQVRIVRPGLDFAVEASAEDPGVMEPAEGLHTQRVVLEPSSRDVALPRRWRGDGCLRQPGGPAVAHNALRDFVLASWRTDRELEPKTWRRGLKDLLVRLPLSDGRHVFCLDLDRTPWRCDPTFRPSDATFVWLKAGHRLTGTGAEWDGLPVPGGEWGDCAGSLGESADQSLRLGNLPLLSDQTPLSVGRREGMPGFALRMVSRRTVGGVADLRVPVSAESMSPAAFYLGPRRSARLGVYGENLVLLSEEPSVQLRMDDLFGQTRDSIEEGEFELCFGEAKTESALVVDLASDVDGHRPKPALAGLCARGRVPEDASPLLQLFVPGRLAANYSFGKVIPIGTASAVALAAEPLIVARRIGTPAGFWLVPAAASLILLLALFARRHRGQIPDPRWDLLGLIVLLLDFRFVLTARLLVSEPSSPQQLERWLIAGSHPLLLPGVIWVLASLLERFLDSGRPAAPDPFLAASPKARTDDTAYRSAGWLLFGLACTLVWFAGATDLPLTERLAWMAPLLLNLSGQLLAASVASVAAILVFRFTGRLLAKLSIGASDPLSLPPSFSRRRRPQMKNWGRWMLFGLSGGLALLAPRFLALVFGWQESIAGVRLDVFYLPLTAGVLAAMSLPLNRAHEGPRLLGVCSFGLVAYLGVGFLLRDLGLFWIGGMALVLTLPLAYQGARPMRVSGLSIILLFFLFLSPKFLPVPFIDFLEWWGGTREIAVQGREITVRDTLQVHRERDQYRMMDAVQPRKVEGIAAQIAREVAVERQRVRYQALEGAWREGFRSVATGGSTTHGAGMLQARPIIGQASFREAARSDYVYPLYVRAEYGSMGLTGLLLIYAAIFSIGRLVASRGPAETPLGTWALALAVGSALFMLGGTSAIFPFSGKWPLLMSLGSGSDVSLAIAFFVLACLRSKRS